MAEKLIEIKWSYGFEYLSIDPDNLPQDNKCILTNECWTGSGREVEYNTVFQRVDVGAPDSIKFALKYEHQKNAAFDEDEISWGRTEFTILGNEVSAKFTPSRGRDKSKADQIPDCKFLENGVDDAHIKRGLVNVILRARQQTLRRELIDAHGQNCVISGEQPLEVLDAAHIVAVQDGGVHTRENAFLLRADLHRLFDAGLLTIASDGRIQVAPEATKGIYGEFNENKKLSPLVLILVQKALKKREEIEAKNTIENG